MPLESLGALVNVWDISRILYASKDVDSSDIPTLEKSEGGCTINTMLGIWLETQIIG